MILDLEIQEEGEWFYYFYSHIDQITGEVIYDDPVKDARVKIRSLAPYIEQRFAERKKQKEHVLNPKTRAMERIEYYPDLSPEKMITERENTWDYVIQGLDGFQNKKTKKEIACTRENKIKLMKLPVFDRFIARCLQLLDESGVQTGEEEIANLKTGSSSATTKPDSG
jgi:hypothetical protein